MERQPTTAAKAPILVLPDATIGRERQALLAKTWALLKNLGPLTLLSAKTTENQLLELMKEQRPRLVLLPWQQYLAWARVEAFFGLTRTSGPTVAGYFAVPIERQEIGALTPFHRAILLDFASTNPVERWRLVNALVHEDLRSGIRPLVGPKATLHFEDWLGSHPPGATLDSLIALPSLRQAPWKSRLPAVQLLTLALWNIAFEQGRALARGDWLTKMHAARVRAYFEIAMDSECLALRLCFQQTPNTSKTILRDFWPEATEAPPSDFRQVLLQHADFLRVHPISDMTEVEFVAGLLRSAPAHRRPGELRSLWIEPLAMNLVSEVPTLRAPSRRSHEKPLPPLADAGAAADAAGRHDRRIEWLEREIAERDSRIAELLAGGIEGQAVEAEEPS